MEYMALFFTHSGAIRYDKFLREKGIKVQLMPVPRKLSSNCGIGARFSCEEKLQSIVSEDIEKVYEIEGSSYKLQYSCD